MTNSLDALLAALEVALRPYCGTVELQTSFGGHCLRIRVDSLESRGPACAVVEAIIDQGDVDEHTRLFDLARTLGVERAAAMHPLPPLAKLN